MKIDICIPTKNKDFSPDMRMLERAAIDVGKVHISYSVPLSKARTELIQQVTTEWFLFLDDDVELCEGWFEKMQLEFIFDNSGAVYGFPITPFTKIIRKITFRRGVKRRGLTSNTLIRTEAARGIELLSESRLEDFELQWQMEQRGWRWVAYPVYSKHHKSTIKVLKEALGDFITLWQWFGFREAVRMI